MKISHSCHSTGVTLPGAWWVHWNRIVLFRCHITSVFLTSLSPSQTSMDGRQARRMVKIMASMLEKFSRHRCHQRPTSRFKQKHWLQAAHSGRECNEGGQCKFCKRFRQTANNDRNEVEDPGCGGVYVPANNGDQPRTPGVQRHSGNQGWPCPGTISSEACMRRRPPPRQGGWASSPAWCSGRVAHACGDEGAVMPYLQLAVPQGCPWSAARPQQKSVKRCRKIPSSGP